MVIPNSKIVINPNPVSADGEDGGSATWRRELYLRPGEWIPWVGVSVVATMVGLAGVVLVLHLNEKVRRGLIPKTMSVRIVLIPLILLFQREDEMERRRASHHINFDAL